MSKLLVPLQGTARAVKSLIAPYNSTAKNVVKAYGSFGGLSKQIFPSSAPTPPWDPTNPNWDALSEIVKRGEAENYLTLGQEIPVKYRYGVMPMVVCGFETRKVRVNGNVILAPAVNLSAGMATYDAVKFSAINWEPYSASNVYAYIRDTEIPEYDSKFIEYLGDVEVISKGWGTIGHTSYGKMYVPSAIMLSNAHSGFPEYQYPNMVLPWFSVDERTAATRRVRKMWSTDTTASWWLRDGTSKASILYSITTGGVINTGAYVAENNVHIVPFCDFIGKY